MANLLDEMSGTINDNGKDINVIATQIPVIASFTDKLFVYGIALLGVALIVASIIIKNYILTGVGAIIVLYIFFTLKNLESYFSQLEQKVQQQASQIDNYLENRVVILQNTAKLVEKAVDLDKELLTNIAKLRSGKGGEDRNNLNSNIENISTQMNIVLENYPDIKAHSEIRDAMQQNSYLQREITAARELYNDVVYTWNREIFSWPFKKVVASNKRFTTRIPFIASKEVKEKAREVFF